MDEFEREPEFEDAQKQWLALMKRSTAIAAVAEASAALPSVPGYEIEAEIARGGMGVVYKARNIRLNRPAALKMILAGQYQDQVTRIRFLVEAEAVASLQHSHIVQVYEFDQYDNLPFIAMEYVGGGTLADQLTREGKPTPTAVAEMVTKLADAVAAAHAKGIVHRDLKPANILLTEAGEPKITDFGLAKVGDSAMTAPGTVMGSASYMSPEQAAGKVKEVGTPADVWALGAILYECLTGRPPFKGESLRATLNEVLTRDPVPPRSIDAKVPRDLETICLKCLQKEPRKRYSTAAALGDDLRRFRKGLPILARPVGLGERAWMWVRRHPGRAGGIVAGITLAAGLLIGFNVVRKQQERAGIAKAQAIRAEDLVGSLATAETAAVPQIIDRLADVRQLARPKLAEHAGDRLPARATKLQLHAWMALLAEEPERATELTAYLPTCRPEELSPIRGLLQAHAAAAAPVLWKLLTDKDSTDGNRVRAACALAGLAPKDPRWPAAAPTVVQLVVKENPLDVVIWAEALKPISEDLLQELMGRYPASRQRIRSGELVESALVREESAFDLTAKLLAQYTTDRPKELAELAIIVDARHYPLFEAAISANRADLIPALKDELTRTPLQHWSATAQPPLAAVAGFPVTLEAIISDREYDALAKRQGHAAAALVTLDEVGPAWRLFLFPEDGDPGLRSYLLQRLAGIKLNPLSLVRRFHTNPDTSEKLALLIALGDFLPDLLPTEVRYQFIDQLLLMYRQEQDPGVHSTIEWLLKQKWERGKDIAQRNDDLAKIVNAQLKNRVVPGPGPAQGHARQWYWNGQDQTYAVIRGPVQFLIGSPPTEPGRISRRERTDLRVIGYTFAIATKEVTNSQFDRFRRRRVPEDNERYSREPDSPAVSVTWYEAAAYCNWLSQQEGILQDQWCYEPHRIQALGCTLELYMEGMTIKPNHLKLTGYRLPTEAEWEYACRSGSRVSRYFGRSEELLPRYGWALKSEYRAWPVGLLRPNEFGLFDSLGNALEWVEDFVRDDKTKGTADLNSELALEVTENCYFISRGGSFGGTARHLRAANRNFDKPSEESFLFGFRPARTLPPE